MINGKILLLSISLSLSIVGLFTSCGSGAPARDNTLIVSIEPLRFIVEEIVGEDFTVSVLVPPGSSPETYEPTPLQIREAEDARLIFSTGLIDFERVVMERLPSPERFVNLSAGIELISDEHGGFGSSSDTDGHDVHSHHEGSGHSHGGIDPHIWVAPKSLTQMAQTAYERIHELYPDSVSYTSNYKRLTECLTELDREISKRVATSFIRSFMIFHPGLTYYARDYGLRQVALENDGKEPSVRQLAEAITVARTEGISRILYQSEFPRHMVEVVAAEIGAEPVEIDILDYDIIDNILKITDLIIGTGNTITPAK